MWGPYTARYLTKRSKVHQKRPSGLHERTSDNIGAARRFSTKAVRDLSEEEKRQYDEYKDVHLEPYQCGIPGYDDTAKATSQIWASINEYNRVLGNPLLADDLWAEAERLCGMCYHRRDHVAEINEYIRECTTGKLLAIVDRDPRRRASMDEQGYLWRLWKQFASVPELYKMRDDLSPEQVAEYRHGMAVDSSPRRLWKKTMGCQYHSVCLYDLQGQVLLGS